MKSRNDRQKELPEIRPGQCIAITERKCGDKVQPHIQVGDIFLVHAVEQTAKGTVVLVVYKDKKEYRCNADRFSWKYWDADAEKRRIRAKKMAAMDVMMRTADQAAWEIEKKKLLSDFTFAEQAKITYIPMMVYIMAWDYATRATDYAARHRIEEVKKLSRTVKMLRDRYVDFLRKDISLDHLKQIRRQTQLFVDEHELLFTQWYYTVLNALNHQHVGVEHDELSAYAFLAKLLLSFLYEFENEMTELIRRRMGSANEVHLPHQKALMACMDAYIGNHTIGMTHEIETALRVFANEINRIEYVTRPQS